MVGCQALLWLQLWLTSSHCHMAYNLARVLAKISVHLQGLYGRYCAHLCQMRYASHMLWVRPCHMQAAAQLTRLASGSHSKVRC